MIKRCTLILGNPRNNLLMIASVMPEKLSDTELVEENGETFIKLEMKLEVMLPWIGTVFRGANETDEDTYGE